MKKVVFVFLALLVLEACSVLTLVKDCSKVEDGSGRYVCRTLKPLE